MPPFPDPAPFHGRVRRVIRVGALSSALGVAIAGLAAPGADAASAAPSNPGLVGTVQSIDRSTSTFIVKEQSGTTVRVKVTSSTRYRERGVTSPGFSDVKVGRSVAVIGTEQQGTETAATVMIGVPGGGRGPGGGAFGGATIGTVRSIDRQARTFTVATSGGSSVRVEVSASTTFRERGVGSAGFSDLKVGARVAVIGTSANGVEKATSVILGLGAAPPGT